ncbi:methionine synthase reductase [Drosophila nasuta]|uniref:methionine synthase reductase n=1 Tax=Drosophila nasuta TaxID=42062 RepID=UPI00295F1FEA|nr:methionine synthase reductase [Drosophila nasuta]
MGDTDQLDNPIVLDIAAYTLTEYVAAKPLESNLEVVFTDAKQSKPCAQPDYDEKLKFPFIRDNYKPTAVHIIDAQELVSADAATETKRVVELTLDLTPLAELNYDPGDTLAVLPCNNSNVVAKLLQRLNLTEQADITCYVRLVPNCTKKTAKVPVYVPTSATPREIFTFYLNLHGVPQKQFLSALANCTSDVKERAFLDSLSAKQGVAHYQSLILERGVCLMQLLDICGSCMPTLALLVEHLPRLLPRPYSIANSPLKYTKQLRIIYSILDKKPGVTTSMLDTKLSLVKEQQVAKLFVYPRTQNSFRFTAAELPGNQILIAVGTALAPFLGFLAHKELSESKSTGQTWLYVGAKTPQAVLKQQQLSHWEATSVLQRLRVCYSRTSTGDEPKYVQDLLETDAAELVDLLQQPSTVMYICADGAKISKSIEETVRGCLQRVLQLDGRAALEKIKELRSLGKYREDIWL